MTATFARYLCKCIFGLSLAVSSLCETLNNTKHVTNLYLIGMFPTTGWLTIGQGVLPAAEMAVFDINNRSDILPGYKLHMDARNTKCDSGLGMKIVAEQVFQQPTKIMIIGPTCSTVCQAVAQTAHHWNLVQISYGATSPALSNKHKYPNFFRTVTSESLQNEARMELIKYYNWRRVSMLCEDQDIYSMMVEDLAERMKKNNIEITAQVGFSEDPETAIQRLKEADARIIVTGFYLDKARKIFCSAYNNGFYGKQVWIAASSTVYLNSQWIKTDQGINCTVDQMMKVVQNTLLIRDVHFNLNETEEGLTGMSVQRFKRIFEEKTGNMTRRVSGEEYSPDGYDTVWAAAIALNKTENHLKETGSKKTLADFTYSDKEIADLLKAKLTEVSFRSVSGKVAFNKNGDGLKLIAINMIREFEQPVVGYFDSSIFDGSRLTIEDILNGSTPKDAMQIKKIITALPVHIYIVMTSLAGLGIILALSFLSFNIFFKNVRVIQMSSPNINNIILVGCVLAYISVFVADTNINTDSIYCKVRNFLLLQAFSLAFGALFAKTWRVYTIITATRQFKTLKARSVKDRSLFLMIFGLVILNSVVLCVWFIVDPQMIVTENISHKEEREDMLIQYSYTFCSSVYQNYFLVTILVIQGIFLLLGIFLAWETRKIQLTILNESRYIGMCIYNIVVLGIVGVLVSYSVIQNTSFLYVINSCITIVCTTVTQCLLFVPKVMAYKKYSQGKLDVLTSLAEEFNLEQPRDKECQTDLPDATCTKLVPT